MENGKIPLNIIEETIYVKRGLIKLLARINRRYDRINDKLKQIMSLLRNLDNKNLKKVKKMVKNKIIEDYKEHKDTYETLLVAYNSKIVPKKDIRPCLSKQKRLMELERKIISTTGIKIEEAL